MKLNVTVSGQQSKKNVHERWKDLYERIVVGMTKEQIEEISKLLRKY